jgi:hypothetical protein
MKEVIFLLGAVSFVTSLVLLFILWGAALAARSRKSQFHPFV